MNHATGNLLAQPRGILVQGCNAQGKMGSGLAKAVRDQFPQAYDDYMATHRQQGLRVGQVVFSVVAHDANGPSLVVANAITQEFYGRDPNRRYVSDEGMSEAFGRIAEEARALNLPVFFPLIGCGLANGQWAEIGPRIERALAGVTHTLITPRPLDEELQLIGQARAQAQTTSSGYRSVEPPVVPAGTHAQPVPVPSSEAPPPTPDTPRRSMFPHRRGR